jgi:hypothetical protein
MRKRFSASLSVFLMIIFVSVFIPVHTLYLLTKFQKKRTAVCLLSPIAFAKSSGVLSYSVYSVLRPEVAEPEADGEPAATIYAGWLSKQAPKGLRWQKRFFVLRRKEMLYYKDRGVCILTLFPVHTHCILLYCTRCPVLRRNFTRSLFFTTFSLSLCSGARTARLFSHCWCHTAHPYRPNWSHRCAFQH